MSAPRAELLHELISAAALTTPHHLAIAIPGGPTVSFAEFDGQIAGIAGWLRGVVDPGARVAVIADNSLAYAQLYYAAPRAGCLLTLINQRLAADEMADQLRRVEPALVLGDAEFLTKPPTPDCPHISFQSAEWQAAQRCSDPGGVVTPDNPAWLLFTSGSTGTPKAVVHSHRSILAAVRGSVRGRNVRPGGVYLLPFPMCHIAGYNMLVQHAVGNTVLPVAAFRPDEFVSAVNEFGVTAASLAPTMLHSLLTYLNESGATVPTLREIAYGSAAIPADLLRRALDTLDVGFHQGYGMTETGGNVTFLGPDDHRAGLLASAGRSHADVELRIADDGEILIRGAQVAPATWPDLTPLAVDGWLHTGDVGRIDEQGRLQVVDRLKDIIITGGENVSSREVEDALSTHADVDEVAVVGVPDEYWGEAICAAVVPTAGTVPTLESLKNYVGQHLAQFKRPRHLLLLTELPRTTNGKVDKVALRGSARAQLP